MDKGDENEIDEYLHFNDQQEHERSTIFPFIYPKEFRYQALLSEQTVFVGKFKTQTQPIKSQFKLAFLMDVEEPWFLFLKNFLY